jgi:hypothetical protein
VVQFESDAWLPMTCDADAKWVVGQFEILSRHPLAGSGRGMNEKPATGGRSDIGIGCDYSFGSHLLAPRTRQQEA